MAKAAWAASESGRYSVMVDNFSIALSHVLMAIALWRLLYRDDLDHEVSPRRLWQQRREAEQADSRARNDA